MPFMCVLRLDLEHRPWTLLHPCPHGKTLAGWTPQCGPRFHGPQPQPAPGLKSSASSSQRAAELESGTEEFLFSFFSLFVFSSPSVLADFPLLSSSNFSLPLWWKCLHWIKFDQPSPQSFIYAFEFHSQPQQINTNSAACPSVSIH